ncbi:hypothetical protein [Kutzneria albida]|uniref:PPE family domain-containing protein n=1 Tax=Kutzneria albida DSM 43870 TaxID=1449976 RepID=W5WL48_9PSEU|nr:hypothetical protein [Kutzneria albida]AHI01939.1 hypothetical protein KALB_8582 [Kutzneria albida DSM 43870]
MGMFEESVAGTAEAAPQRDKLGNYRFEGYSNYDLADQVDKLSKGSGSTVLHGVVDALKDIAKDLTNTNTVLRTELAKIGIDWQSVAGQGATEQLSSHAAYSDGAEYNITDSSGALITQSDSHAVAASAPKPSTDTQKSFVDKAAGVFGYETDHARQVEQAQHDRDEAIRQLNDYQANSKTALEGHQPLGQPPGIDLQAQAVQNTAGATSLAGYVSGSGVAYAGPGGGAGAPFAASGSAGPGAPGFAAPGGLPGGGGVPGPMAPGAVTGAGGLPGSLPTTGMPAAASAAGSALAGEIGLGAAVAGGAGAVAAGANSGSPRGMVRGGSAGGGAGGERAGVSRANSGLGALNEEQAAQARAAERISPQAKQGSSMMQPATDKKKKEEDAEHVRKYGVEADDLFGDQRMVAPPVLGEEPSA